MGAFIAVFAYTAVVFLAGFGLCALLPTKSEEEQKLEDEEQMEYLKKWRKKHENKDRRG